MKVTIEHRIVETFFKGDENGDYEIFAVEPGETLSAQAAMWVARKLADEYIYGADNPRHPELDIINGSDKLEISVCPVVTIDGEEVEVTGDNPPILKLTVSKPAIGDYSEMIARNNLY